MSVLAAGGGLGRGRVAGHRTRKGRFPKTRPVRPQDFLVTVYRQLHMTGVSFSNRAGRPIEHQDGEVIRELLG